MSLGDIKSNILAQLIKALEAGNYNAAPSDLRSGIGFQIEDLNPIMTPVTYNSPTTNHAKHGLIHIRFKNETRRYQK